MKRRRLIVVASIVIILISSLVGFVGFNSFIMDTRYGGQGYVEETGGLSYVSEIYYPENNASYTVNFHDVNFTFLYWTYPSGNNYTVYDAPYTAYFLITFHVDTQSNLDVVFEVLTLSTGSWWTVSGYLKRPLTAVTTEHDNPKAGVLYGSYLDNPVGWQFVLSMD
ncbi:MAG: hypothetical protein ACFFF9_17025 [Candidatus Thorarchaeota archaeon]